MSGDACIRARSVPRSSMRRDGSAASHRHLRFRRFLRAFTRTDRSRRSYFRSGRAGFPAGAVILIVLGLIFLLHTIGMFEFAIDRFWPLILIGFGAWLFARRWGLLGHADGACACDRCKMRCIMWPAIMFTLGVLFLMDNLHGPGFERTWPLILLVIGGVKLLQSNASDAGHVGGPPALPPAGAAPPPAPPMDNTNRPPSEVSNV